MEAQEGKKRLRMTTCLRYYVNYNYFKTNMRSEVSEGNSTALKTGSLGAKHLYITVEQF